MACVYKITSPTNKTYVGSSINVVKRWKNYKNLDCKKQRKLYNSLKKHGYDNHKFEIITECDNETMLQLETHFGLFYNVLDQKAGLNLALPKDGEVYGGYAKNRGTKKPGSSDFKKGDVPWNKGIKGVIIPWNKGVSMSNVSKLKMIKSKIGKPSSKKGIKTGIPIHNAKIILDYNTGVFYYSSTEASKYNTNSRSSINNMLDGKVKNKTSLRYV